MLGVVTVNLETTSNYRVFSIRNRFINAAKLPKNARKRVRNTVATRQNRQKITTDTTPLLASSFQPGSQAGGNHRAGFRPVGVVPPTWLLSFIRGNRDCR